MRRWILISIAICSLLMAACGGDDPEPTNAGQGQVEEEEPAEEEEQADGPDATVAVAESDLGSILVDAEGNTLYMFVPDQEAGEPTCYDDCAAAWPALEADGDPAAGEGIDAALLGTVERTDGAMQVTYNDLPLYLFSGDETAGDTNGQGLNDVWWVVSPSGEPRME